MAWEMQQLRGDSYRVIQGSLDPCDRRPEMTDLIPHSAEGKATTRQCPRFRVQLQFDIGGLDHYGQFFEETVTTKDISNMGGCFRSHNSLKVGSTLRLSGPQGFVSLIRIAWAKRRPDAEDYDTGFIFINPLEN